MYLLLIKFGYGDPRANQTMFLEKMASTSYQPSSSTTTYIAYGTNLSNSPSLRWVAVQIIPLGLFHAPAEFLQETVLGYDI